MPEKPASTKAESKLACCRWIVFPPLVIGTLVGCFLYLAIRVEPRLGLHAFGPQFSWTPAPLSAFAKYPGGPMNWMAAALAQADRVDWLGAGVFTLICALAFLLTRLVLRQTTGREPGIAPLLPVFAFLLLKGKYGCPALAIGGSFTLSLAAAAAYLRLAKRSTPWCVMGAALVSTLVFWLAGLWSVVLFVWVTVIFLGLREKRWTAALFCLVSAAALPAFYSLLADVNPARLVNPWMERVDWTITTALYLSVALLAVALQWLPRTPPTPAPTRQEQRRKPGQAGKLPLLQSSAMRKAAALLAVAAGWTGVLLSFDANEKVLLAIDYSGSKAQYPQVVALARQAKELGPTAEIWLQLALFHTQRLGDELFAFPNQTGWELLPGLSQGLKSCRVQSRVLLELGLVSDAEHLAHEALEIEGNRPDLLYLLAKANVLKERPEAARVFLNVLGQMPFEAGRAAELRAKLAGDPRLAGDSELSAIRSRMLTSDLAHEGFPIDALLGYLLTANPKNRMAFEYLMARHLLNLDMGKVVGRLSQLSELGFSSVPRHYEEAWLLHQQTQGKRIEIAGREPRAETVERFKRFNEALQRQAHKTPEGRAFLAREFGDTFWFYYLTSRNRNAAGADTPQGVS
jgi:hypothetical protein